MKTKGLLGAVQKGRLGGGGGQRLRTRSDTGRVRGGGGVLPIRTSDLICFRNQNIR